jgi:glycosyltransferase involved in cell wall biosynthesis
MCERNPALIPVALWQDREDMFERHDGKPAGADEFVNYLAIRHRIAVSRWILDSAESDRLIGKRTDDEIRQVIWPAVDQAFTSAPPPERTDSNDRPVRILAMWRPMTAVRRGMPRLAALYAALAKHYSGKRAGRVSLEVFGWTDGVPAGVVSHGHLTTAQVAAVMREVDIVVEPSEFQGFGLPGMEAIACGAALVTTPCRGPQEYAQPGVNAIVADDHDSLLPAVRRLVDDPAELRLIQTGAAKTWPPVTWADRAREFAMALHIAAGLAAREGA